MALCSSLLLLCLLSITVLHCSVQGLQQRPPQHIDRAGLRTPALLRRRPAGTKSREDLKLLRSDDRMTLQNDVIGPKRRRSFPGNNAPLDRLSASSVETKPAKKKQSKAAESPRQRNNPAPIDRVGMGRLPAARG